MQGPDEVALKIRGRSNDSSIERLPTDVGVLGHMTLSSYTAPFVHSARSLWLLGEIQSPKTHGLKFTGRTGLCRCGHRGRSEASNRRKRKHRPVLGNSWRGGNFGVVTQSGI
jgi:hypothetical protein